MNGHDLKQLQVRLTKLKADFVTLDIAKHEAQQAYEDAARKIKMLEAEIANCTKEPILSEHALLRYIEREKGLDIDSLRNEIMTSEFKLKIRTIGSGKIPLGRCNAIVKDMVVTTIA